MVVSYSYERLEGYHLMAIYFAHLWKGLTCASALALAACAPPGYHSETLETNISSSSFDWAITGLAENVPASTLNFLEKQNLLRNSFDLYNFMKHQRGNCKEYGENNSCEFYRFSISRYTPESTYFVKEKRDIFVTIIWAERPLRVNPVVSVRIKTTRLE